MSNDFDVTVAMIVAMADNRVIGRNNQLPWYLPGDLKYFKAVTLGKPVIMGRKTYESIGRPLPGRANIVVTGNRDYHEAGVKVVHSVEEALELAVNIAIIDGAKEVMVIGGAEIYRAALPATRKLYLTQIHANVDGDAFFPELDWCQWQELVRDDFFAEGPNPYDYSFVVYQRSGE